MGKTQGVNLCLLHRATDGSWVLEQLAGYLCCKGCLVPKESP